MNEYEARRIVNQATAPLIEQLDRIIDIQRQRVKIMNELGGMKKLMDAAQAEDIRQNSKKSFDLAHRQRELWKY
jgi:hypothetical protein